MKLVERVEEEGGETVTAQHKEMVDPVTGAVDLKIFDCFYQMAHVEGYEQERPIVHCICRDKNRNRWHVQVEGFDPYFCVPRAEVTAEKLVQLDNDPNVLDVRMNTDPGIRGEDLVTIVTVAPYHVPQLREAFDEPYEADVVFSDRFLADMDINQGLRVPRAAQERRVTPMEIETADESDVTSVRPRICYIDIEVKRATDGPAVVSETGIEMSNQPITGVTLYDNYSDSYHCWVLAHGGWESEDFDACGEAVDAEVNIYGSERTMLQHVCGFISDLQPDCITAWNISFDIPYTINRCMEQQVTDVKSLSPVGEVDRMDGGGSWINSDLKGVVLFDLLQGFKKTSRHELDSNSLEHVASEVTDIEKLDVDEQWAWENAPDEFVRYNRRDVEAMVEINDARGIL